MYEEDDEIIDDECPSCMIGRIRGVMKPFVRLYHNHLFCIPDALCWECDLCGYYEFDETNYDLIHDMLDGANYQMPNVKESQTLPTLPPDEDATSPRKFPPA
jgi:hypothetical protein